MASFNDQMHVTKRNGSNELVSFDKIQKRVENLCNNIEPKLNINYGQLVMQIRPMNTNSYTHPHMLWSFNNNFVNSHKISSF